MRNSMVEIEIDDEWETDISIWVSTEKTEAEFEASLSQIIYPVVIENGIFSIGAIEIQIKNVKEQPKPYEGVPQDKYAFEIVVPTTQDLIWGCFDKKVVYAITLGLRTKFSCAYIVTTDSEELVFYSGTNKPYYLNSNYQPCINGELLPVFNDRSQVVELRI
jgi:hypothetical protein